MRGWLPPFFLYLAHVGCGWPLPQQGEQALQGRTGSLGQYFYTAISRVTCISARAKHQGMFNDNVAEADPLHPSTYVGMQFLNLVAVVQVCHRNNHSRLLLICPEVRILVF